MITEPNRTEEVFTAALKMKAGPERTAFLDDICGEDLALREHVEALLLANDTSGNFLQSPFESCLDTESGSCLLEEPGTMIGQYKLLELIGKGGMAVVYMAEQQEPIRRKVALKIIKLGMDTKSVIARFEAERQALALMDHPNIAKVFDAGATEAGRPYFVMELVTGVSITEYCDKNNLSTKQRLALFIQVSNAVQHAHQKGIIHRDIKPTNVMVTQRDGEPIPKVIDFGIAKATNQRLTEKTLFTRYAHIIGTPAYMSPEQAESSDFDVDTRSDIYSLGVLLYELLTGTTPFSEKELRKAGYLEMQRIIREKEPDKPSTKLSTLGETLTDIAKYRSSSPELLRKLISGDLDWIIMKSLEKDRTRRYTTASEFTSDIERHLNNEPVLASPPTRLYQMRKMVQRHRVLVTAITVIAASIIIGLAVSTTLYLRMHRALDAVTQLEEKVAIDSKLSTAQKLYAQGRYQAALNEVEQILDAQDLGPKAHLLRARLLIEVGQLEDVEAQLLPLTEEAPEIAGAAHYLLARVHVGVDDTKAEKHEARAKSILPETAEAYSLRAMTAKDSETALKWLNRAIELDPGHYPSRKVRALTHYALGEDQRMMEDVTVLIALRPKDFLGYALRAILRRGNGEFEGAIADHTRVLDLCDTGSERCELYHQRYETYSAMGNHELALSDARTCVELDPQSRTHHMNIFKSLIELEDFVAAKEEYRSIVQTKHEWGFRFNQGAAEYVFDRMSKGKNLTIPPEMVHKAPFAFMQRVALIYGAFYNEAKLLSLQRQGFILWGWSPDGRELLVGTAGFYGGITDSVRRTTPRTVSGPAVLKIIDTESGQERLIASAYGNSAAWSPDGKYIAFQNPDHDICVIPANGGESRRVISGRYPYWSKDSRRLYFWTGWPQAEVCSINIDDLNPVPQKLVKCSGKFVINEDKDWIACKTSTGFKMVHLTSGALLYQFRSPWPYNYWGMSLSPDGRELCFKAWWSSPNIGPLILDTQEMQLYRVFDYPVDNLFRSQDGSKLAIGTRPTAWVLDMDPNVPICHAIGQVIPNNDLTSDLVQAESQEIASDPLYPENYLERAMAYMALGRSMEAKSDLLQFDSLVTKNDHHLGCKVFTWIKQYYQSGLYEEAELLIPHAEKLMDSFPDHIPSYRNQIEQIIKWSEGKDKPEIAARWKAKLHKFDESNL